MDLHQFGRGTTHHPPVLNKNSFPIDEATVSAAYLIERNIPSNKILIENWSFDTIGNAHFARQSIDRCEKYSIEYFTVSNQDTADDQLVARIDKEHIAREDLKTKIQKINNFSQMA
ncbi:unnamed protein product [Rotaria magnacalcarata]|uniref:DUF218 domain-containing protein n=1 Tax=Rotaria magnacalcarata TaxID=392030 RepID=A0A8S2KVS3_9BILA|nr:unnamed protein product [Rotaria magnacalcarata]